MGVRSSSLSLFEISHNNGFFKKRPLDCLGELDLLFLDAFAMPGSILPGPVLGLQHPGNIMCHKLISGNSANTFLTSKRWSHSIQSGWPRAHVAVISGRPGLAPALSEVTQKWRSGFICALSEAGILAKRTCESPSVLCHLFSLIETIFTEHRHKTGFLTAGTFRAFIILKCKRGTFQRGRSCVEFLQSLWTWNSL